MGPPDPRGLHGIAPRHLHRRRSRARRPARLLGLAAAAALAACAPAAPAIADDVTLTGGAIAIPSTGAAAPSPATLTVAGTVGRISAVDLVLSGIDHPSGADLDVLLVSPAGRHVMLLSDTCRGTLSGATLTFTAPAASLPAVACGTRAAQPTDVDAGDPDALAPDAPAAPHAAAMTAFAGDAANGAWRLYVADDTPGGSGAIASWRLRVRTTVAIPASGNTGPAAVYPWPRTVAAAPGAFVRDVDVSLDGLTHRFLGELHIELSSPDGRTATLMSNGCGNAAISAVTMRFDDAAGDPAPLYWGADCLLGGPFTASDHAGPDDPPMPAPAPTGGPADLAAWEGRPQASGDWRLWVADDAEGDTGDLPGWTLRIRSGPAAPVHFSMPAVRGQEGRVTPVTMSRSGTEGVLGEATVSWRTVPGSAGAGADFTALSGVVSFPRGQLERTIWIPVTDDGLTGEAAETFSVALTGATGDAAVAGAAPETVAVPADVPTGEETPTTPTTPTTPVTSTVPLERADRIIVLPTTKACVRRARLSVRFRRPRRGSITAMRITVNGRTVRSLRGRAARRPIRSLRVRPARRYRVVVRITLSTKRRLTLTRTLRGCAR